MTPLLQYFDLILDSFPVGASHSLCFSLNAGTPFISMYSNENLQSSLLESFASTFTSEFSRDDFPIYGLASTPNDYIDLASTLSAPSNINDRDKLLQNQRQIMNSILNNPIGMYEDFVSHVLS